jgi:hypothetical protein
MYIDRWIIGHVVRIAAGIALLAGLPDFCLFAPMFGWPRSGPKIRTSQ